jgi:TfoX/Sxy family transcriptional regulator of competence genes
MDEAQKKEEGQGEAIKAARAALKLIDTPYVALASYAVKVGKSLNQQVEQSIKAFGAKKEEAKPEAKPEAKAA